MDDATDGSSDYDSRADTLAHIHRVRDYIDTFVAEILARGRRHDASKLSEPEKSAFDQMLPLFYAVSYGSAKYQALEACMGAALNDHHKANSHHPEHYGEVGIAGMDLFDVVEMVCDWMAAAERRPEEGVRLDLNTARFTIAPQLASVIANTLDRWPKG